MRHLALLVFALLLSATGGCSTDKWVAQRPKVVRVTGELLVGDQPLAGAHVTFNNVAANRSAFGVSDDRGRFTLTTFTPNDGAVPGEQQVSVSKVVMTKKGDADADRTTTLTPSSNEPDRRWLIPEHYGDFNTSGLKAEVTENGPNDIILRLKPN